MPLFLAVGVPATESAPHHPSASIARTAVLRHSQRQRRPRLRREARAAARIPLRVRLRRRSRRRRARRRRSSLRCSARRRRRCLRRLGACRGRRWRARPVAGELSAADAGRQPLLQLGRASEHVRFAGGRGGAPRNLLAQSQRQLQRGRALRLLCGGGGGGGIDSLRLPLPTPLHRRQGEQLGVEAAGGVRREPCWRRCGGGWLAAIPGGGLGGGGLHRSAKGPGRRSVPQRMPGLAKPPAHSRGWCCARGRQQRRESGHFNRSPARRQAHGRAYQLLRLHVSDARLSTPHTPF